jgi:hypothetical protein
MKTFGWLTRVKYGLLAAVAGWSAGWLVSFPFKLSLAWRYVDGDFRRLPISLAEGLLVWAGFSLFMAMAGFVPVMLPSIVLIPPRWIVRWRGLLIPAAPLAASLVMYRRMGFLNLYHFRNPSAVREFFFSALNFFVITFALVVVWTYVGLARRRLSPSVPLAGGR